MDITSEHRNGEITVFVNSATPEVQLTTRREEAKATVKENEQSIITVAENIEAVKDAAQYVDTFDDVIASLPQIMEASTAAKRAEKAEEGATEAKDLSVESASIASASASSATLSAQKASESETKALASEQSAQNSANSASESKTSAQNSALLAAESATSAKQDLDSIKADAEMVAEYAPKAIQAAESAEIAKASAISAAERAEQASQGVEGALADKQDKLTAGEGIKIEGNVISTEGGKLPDNVYTADNLIAGKNVTFTEVPPEGGIDEHTLACWHFTDSASDEVSGLVMATAQALYSGYSKFGEKSLQMLSSTGSSDISSLGLQPTKKSMTMDFWLYNHGSQWAVIRFGGSNTLMDIRIQKTGSMTFSGKLFESSISLSETIPVSFNHYAIQYDYENQEVSFYLNGKNLVKTKVPNVTLPVDGFNYLQLSCYSSNSFISELRISDCVRYTEDFTPPTQPYRKAEPTGKYVVNFTGEAGGSNASFPLFYHTFTDHILNDASWLRSDTFSWQSGDVYVSAYNHLAEEFEGLTAETETVGSTEITFYRAEDGHKIVLADQESNVSAIYAETGVAWYYILDAENKRFKLPRDGNRFRLEANKELLDWDKQETISNNFVAPSSGFIVVGVQANDNHYYAYVTPKDGTQVSVYGGYNNDAGAQWSFIVNEGDTFSATAFNNGIFVPFLPSVKGVEEERKKFLYLFVGNTVRNQTEINVGTVTEQLNSKQDVLGNNVDYVVETFRDGANWYRIYKSGWVEQGGNIPFAATGSWAAGNITFLKPMADTNYYLNGRGNWNDRQSCDLGVNSKTTTGCNVTVAINTLTTENGAWYVCGQGA